MILCALLTQTLDNIVSKIAVDTFVAQINVVGRRWFSRLSTHCYHRQCIILFKQWLWIQLLLKLMRWDGAGTQDSQRFVNPNLGYHCFNNGFGYNCCSNWRVWTALVLKILSALITQTMYSIVSKMCLDRIDAQCNVLGRRLYSRISAYC
jgi:hypothetical protein